MILDYFLQFTGGTTGVGNSDNATDTPTSGSSGVSSQIIDLGVGTTTTPGIPSFANGGGARDIGIGDDPAMKVMVEVTTAMTSGNTCQILLQGAPDDGSGGQGTYFTMATGPAITSGAVGQRLLQIDMPRPPYGLTNAVTPRFLRLNYVITNTTNSAGKIRGCLVLDRDDHVQQSAVTLGGYPAGITIAN